VQLHPKPKQFGGELFFPVSSFSLIYRKLQKKNAMVMQAVKPERELSKFAPSKSLVSVTCTLKR